MINKLLGSFWMRLDHAVVVYLIVLSLFVTGIQAKSIPPTSFFTNFEHDTFTTQHGVRFKPADSLGKVTLVHFIYTKCATTCPVQVTALRGINQALSTQEQSKVQFISVSLDSMYDKPKVLADYAKRMQAISPNWLFLSAEYEAILGLSQRLLLFGNPNNPKHPKVDVSMLKTKNNEEVLDKHMTTLWLVDQKGRLIQRYQGSPMDSPRITREIKQLLMMQ